jgi:glycosyltransferase involved in cell wall biosynthesis
MADDISVPTVKVDLHVHSEFSDRPYSWFLRSAKAAECYTAVERVYEIATQRGMDLVTISDHDTIDGARELCSRYPDNTFVSVEVSARFPEDGCVVHTIAVDIDEAQHAEMQRLRRNVYELVEYMDQQAIAYFWCHPLSQVNGRLTRQHLERCFLMFRALELRNGTRDIAHEQRLLDVVARITPARLAEWADRNPRVPVVNRDGRYAYVGGSDDHGSLAIARAYTELRGPATGAGVTAALRAAATVPGGESGTSSTLAHNCYGVVAGFFKASGQLGATAAKAAGHRHDHEHQQVSDSLIKSLFEQRVRLGKAGTSFDGLWTEGHTNAFQERVREAAEGVLVETWRDAVGKIAGAVSGGRVAEAADGLPALVKSLFLELPYLLANRYHVRDRSGAHRFADELGAGGGKKNPRVAIVTDTLDSVDGVAIGLRRLVGEARAAGRELLLIGPGEGTLVTSEDGVVRIPGVYAHRLAEYPQYAWTIPHLPALLRVLCEREVDLIQCSTPGPMGVAAMIAGRITGIPVIGQYHTDVPEYALRLTGDPTAASMVHGLVGLFYRSLDHVLVPSDHVRDIVMGMGVDGARISKVPRGIDLSLFRPERRNAHAFDRWGLNGQPKVLYVGRISREKGLDHLLDGFRQVCADVPEAQLVLVGDGPLRGELEAAAPADRTVFTGVVRGEDLATLFASADVFVFPSETETFGNVVVEAQAAGLPVVVTDRGAARELVVDGVTGFVADARQPVRFGDRMSRLLRDPELRARMGRAAVEHARRFDQARAMDGTFAEYERVLAAASVAARPLGMVGS